VFYFVLLTYLKALGEHIFFFGLTGAIVEFLKEEASPEDISKLPPDNPSSSIFGGGVKFF
jgi:hypothetical protein